MAARPSISATNFAAERGSTAVARTAVLGLLAFALLAIRFSPNWWKYRAAFHVAEAEVRAPAERPIARKGFQDPVCVARGIQVMRQVADPGTTIDNANHKIVRWRLLFPALGHVLRVPPLSILSLGLLGCLAFVLTLSALGYRISGSSWDGFALAIVGGATAPFFASAGWLGYYDAWLALAIIIVTCVRSRVAVWFACLLAPWIDERMVLALPLALCVRWAWFGSPSPTWKTWVRHEAIPPLLLIAAFTGVRLSLGATAGSQTVRDYFELFVFARYFDPARMLYGTWEGLRLGWFVVLCAGLVGAVRFRRYDRSRVISLLVISVVAGASLAIGLLSALDISRSMILVLPLVPLAWAVASRTQWWHKFHAGPALAAAALVLPAHHVVSRFVMPVDNLWSTPVGVGEALNYIGVAYRIGVGVPHDDAEAAKWFREAVALGSPGALANLGLQYRTGAGVTKDVAEAMRLFRLGTKRSDSFAQSNIGMMYFVGDGLPADAAEAAKWFRLAAQQGDPVAQSNLGTMILQGQGVPRDAREAAKWYRRAGIQGDATAQSGLGVLYSLGDGVPKDGPAAVKWFRKAALRGHPRAQSNLGIMYANGDGVPRDEVEALAWFYLAAEADDGPGRQFMERGERNMNPQKIAQARSRSAELRRLIQKDRP